MKLFSLLLVSAIAAGCATVPASVKDRKLFTDQDVTGVWDVEDPAALGLAGPARLAFARNGKEEVSNMYKIVVTSTASSAPRFVEGTAMWDEGTLYIALSSRPLAAVAAR